LPFASSNSFRPYLIQLKLKFLRKGKQELELNQARDSDDNEETYEDRAFTEGPKIEDITQEEIPATRERAISIVSVTEEDIASEKNAREAQRMGQQELELNQGRDSDDDEDIFFDAREALAPNSSFNDVEIETDDEDVDEFVDMQEPASPLEEAAANTRGEPAAIVQQEAAVVPKEVEPPSAALSAQSQLVDEATAEPSVRGKGSQTKANRIMDATQLAPAPRSPRNDMLKTFETVWKNGPDSDRLDIQLVWSLITAGVGEKLIKWEQVKADPPTFHMRLENEVVGTIPEGKVTLGKDIYITFTENNNDKIISFPKAGLYLTVTQEISLFGKKIVNDIETTLTQIKIRPKDEVTKNSSGTEAVSKGRVEVTAQWKVLKKSQSLTMEKTQQKWMRAEWI